MSSCVRSKHPLGTAKLVYPAKCYAGIPADRVAAPSYHLLGRPIPTYSTEDGRAWLIDCSCGCSGCDPYAARIVIGEEVIHWRDLGKGNARDENRGALGEFKFDRLSYELELEALAHIL
jgi:hypothetical protein